MYNVSFAKARSADARREAELIHYYVSANETVSGTAMLTIDTRAHAHAVGMVPKVSQTMD
jgi:hypothetical protein